MMQAPRVLQDEGSPTAHRVQAAKPQVHDHEEELRIVAVPHAVGHPLHQRVYIVQYQRRCSMECG